MSMPYMPVIRFAGRAVFGALGFWIASRVLAGVHTYGLYGVLAAFAVLGAANALVRPALEALDLPSRIMSLVLFLFAVNVVLVFLIPLLLRSIRIPNPMDAVFAALIISLVSWLGNALSSESLEGLN